ncbi:MAG: serine/threonine protein kinase [Bdellovibrionaceae bacterium]|nr:serine/threonine protein kinase [Pseudobdellovibrionaceae bacterium]
MMSQFERFGKYILLEKLAAGGMAEIYLAKSLGAQGVNKFLAVKRVLPQFSENPEFKEMFREEARVSVNLRHSNVVPIFDFGEEKNQFYLVMEYVEGRNLRQILNELKKHQVQFSIEQICYVIREAAGGLDHAHRCIDGSTGRPLNIIHRDISPQNIMVSFEGEVKIIDFGIAKAESQVEATKAGTLKGKFGYMSPEQADGHQIDVRTDIFSLGIVFWELLANDRLFTASSEAAILRKIRECQIPSIRKINPNVPPELEKIVNKVLAKDPNLRYQTAAALHKDLNRFLNTQYPDFNAQDFAVFVKNTFASTYQESRRKLVDYAKAQNGDPRESTGSGVRAAARNDATVIDHSLPAEIENLNLDTSTAIKVELQQKGRHTRAAAAKWNNGGIGPAQPWPMNPNHTGTRAPIPDFSRPSGLFDKILGLTMPAAIIAIFAIGGWWAWSNGLVAELFASNPVNAVTEQKKDSGTVEPASSAMYRVTITSEPMGARIFFDGEDQKKFTPYMLDMPSGRVHHITLKREGYYPHESDFTPVKDAQTLKATLQPLGRAAYVTISLVNGGNNPVLEVNGRRLGEKITDRLVQPYPIPAGVPVQIRARNSFTGAMAEQTVTLQPEQRKNVELILGTTPAR